jgi:AcrR family transcriptional regulator
LLPAPSKTSLDAIVAAGRQILESDGLDGLTLQAVAHQVGVRPPSLYKRIDGRGDLIRRIGNDVAVDLEATMETAATTGDPRTDLRAMVHAVRAFARRHPRGYALLFAPLPDESRVDSAVNARISAIILRATGAVAGPDEAMQAARMVVAWLNGFVTMEQAGAFRLGGSIDEAFDYGIDRILVGLQHSTA